MTRSELNKDLAVVKYYESKEEDKTQDVIEQDVTQSKTTICVMCQTYDSGKCGLCESQDYIEVNSEVSIEDDEPQVINEANQIPVKIKLGKKNPKVYVEELAADWLD